MKSLVCQLLVVLAISPVQAKGQKTLYPDYDRKGKPVVIRGQGGDSCGSFIENKRPYNLSTGAHIREMAWILGFITGIDLSNPFTVRQYDYNGLDLWIEKYCDNHPIDNLVTAANDFYSYIGGRLPTGEDYSIWKHYPNYNPGR